MKNLKFFLLSTSLLLLLQITFAQSKSKTIIIKQYQQDNGEWKTDTIGNFDLSKMLNFKFDIDQHIQRNIAHIDSLIPDKSKVDSMMATINEQMKSLDKSLDDMTRLIAAKVPKAPQIRSKIDSLIKAEIGKTQIKIITGNNSKKVMLVNGNKIEIIQDKDKNTITVDYYSDESGEFSLQLMTEEESVLYEKKEELSPGKYSFTFSTDDYKSGHYLIKIQHNHLFLLEQLQIMHN
ncbi:MAG: hypothetical protein C0599_12480 [Salinivirgaceae bacterium]|nr:MAG: hypothetical protein C0599_12480 [Salinivirgaceae bacterium]